MNTAPSEAIHQTILDSITDGVFTVDNGWCITSFNRAAEKITGISRESALGRRCHDVFHADVCETGCLLRKTMQSGRPCVNRTVSIIDRKGRSKPVSISTAVLTNAKGAVVGGVETFRDISELVELRREAAGIKGVDDFLTQDPHLLAKLALLPSIAQSDAAVLIQGESGTGKEVIARALHRHSSRSKGPFIAVNCGAIPEHLVESELFGYHKGAFTDAKTDKPGRFELASGGTLFLDEIGYLPRPIQVKLLRVLQEREFVPLGGTAPISADARIVAATNVDLSSAIEEGRFRKDLFYRLAVVPLTLTPLRERGGDIPLLADHFIARFNALMHREVERIAPDAMQLLLQHPFPGNVRELENLLHHAFVLSRGTELLAKHFPESLTAHAPIAIIPQKSTCRPSGAAPDKEMIIAALDRNRWNRHETARALGVHPATLWRWMKRENITG